MPSKKDVYTWLMYARKLPAVGKLLCYLVKLPGSEIPISVPTEPGCLRDYGGQGVVIHSNEIGNDVILSPGCKILCKQGLLQVGNGTVIGANAVLLQSTGEYEIWPGSPARCIGQRLRIEEQAA